jgi:hypothetical protein
MQRLTPLKIRYYFDNGKPRYWFNDPVNCHCVYVGNEKNYQQYEQIRLRQKAVQQEAEAARMNEEAAEQEQMNMMLWPGPFIMYGPRIPTSAAVARALSGLRAIVRLPAPVPPWPPRMRRAC